MKHRDSLSGDIVTVELSGKLIAGDQLTSFLGRVQYYLSLNKNRFIVDLHDVERMNSAGIGALVAAHTAATRAGGKFVLTNITRVEDLLNVTQLMRVFESYDSREEAVTALQ
ncbi:MAG: STAS domain-containing protein [bacterium]|nr:STAS domain-containing protein [bacterium]